jgi:DNA topoisomerase-1
MVTLGAERLPHTRAESGSCESGCEQPAPGEFAETAGLVYINDAEPGITRVREGDRFLYRWPDGHEVRHRPTLARIHALVIPPAWHDVWICTRPNGHLQATGRDERGRKQYRYHPRWRDVRDENKFDRLLAFGEALPAIRERTEHDLRRHGLPREKVLATIVRLLETTYIRVGNPEYARANASFGLTTLRDRHARIEGDHLHLHFRGKSGKEHDIDVNNPRLARIVRSCRDIPGQHLFQYIGDDGDHHAIDSGDVNAYLREVSGGEFTAKDFRTWAGTVLAARLLAALPPPASVREQRQGIVRVVDDVAANLGNTRSVCRKCYVHPRILDAHLSGELAAAMERREGGAEADGPFALRPYELAVLDLLRRQPDQALGSTTRPMNSTAPVPRSRR